MDKILLDGRQLSEEEFKKKINKYRVYTDINLVMASDKISTTLLFLLQHLTNLDNLCVSQSFLAKHLGCNERTIRRKLDKLKELGIVTWKSGAKNHRMNDYSINQEKYDVLIATINTLSFEDRLKFINKLFEEKTPKKKKNKKSIEMNSSTEGEQSAIVKTNYSVLSEEKKGSIDYSISECVAQCMHIVGSEMTPDTINVFNRAWEQGVTLCDDFAEQVKTRLIKMEQPQRVFDTLNGLVNKSIVYNQINETV